MDCCAYCAHCGLIKSVKYRNELAMMEYLSPKTLKNYSIRAMQPTFKLVFTWPDHPVLLSPSIV